MSLDTSSQKFGFFKRHYILTGFLVFIIAVVVWWKIEFPSATWNYKVTVLVETPEGLKVGSAVREVRQYTDIQIGDAGGGKAYEQGEAVVIDLGNRGKLFLTVGEDHHFLFRVFPFSKGGNTPEGMRYYSHLKNAKASILGLENLKSLLVTFTNINDPLTVKAVEPNNFAAVFGKGVNLKDITIETTDEPMTRGVIDQALPWLNNISGTLDGARSTYSNKLSNRLDAGDFRTRR